MLSTPIEQTINATGAPLLTDIFLVVMLIVFLFSTIWKKQDKLHAFTLYTPTLLTSLGILGTFMGIVAGLLEFDTGNIDGSIGPLLDGLKTAFITSLAGMLLSIVYKGLGASGVLSKKTEDYAVAADEVTAGDLYAVMSQQVEGIEQLRKAIGGDNEASLVGQFKLLRSDLGDQQKMTEKQLSLTTETVTAIHAVLQQQQQTTEKYLLTSSETLATIQASLSNHQEHFNTFEERLWIKLQDFADMMSKSATEQVVEALKSVIQDFNNNLTEQFGDNFKQLNAAVLELVTWQENYKQQLSDMKVQYDHGVQAITQTETSVAHIGERAQSIPVAMDALIKVMEVNQHQIEELSRHLNAFEQVRDKAVAAVPEIRSQIDQAIAGAREANETMARGVTDSTDKMKIVLLESAENYQDTVDNTRAALTEAATATANSSEEIKEQFRATIDDINNNLRNLVNELQTDSKELKALNSELIQGIREGNQSINASFIEATNNVGENTTRMVSTFGSSIDEMQQSLSGTIKEHAEEHRKQADRVFAGLEKSIEQTLNDTGESVQKQVQMIDKAMESEVTKVMQSMGDALGSISGQFTKDYSRLTQEMSKVINQRHVS